MNTLGIIKIIINILHFALKDFAYCNIMIVRGVTYEKF